MATSCSSSLRLARLSSGSLYPMQNGSCYILNWLKLCFPRWKGAKTPLKVQRASGIHLVDDDVKKIQEKLSIVQILYFCTSFHFCDLSMATLVSRCIAKNQDGGVPEKKEDQKEEGVTLYCSRLRISRTNAKPSLHHVRGIVCRTHSCGL